MDATNIQHILDAALPDAEIAVEGDGRHFQAQVISTEFAGKTMLQQHQMIYKILGAAVGKEIHALSLQTYTPEAWAEQRQSRNLS